MVYVYKKTIGGKHYYYLRASIRKKGRVIVKDIAYLGNSLEEVKRRLENLPKYAVQIRKAYRTINTFLESNHYCEKVQGLKPKNDEFLQEKLLDVEAAKLHFNTKFQNKNETTKNEIFKNFSVEFAFNTTSIEGNTIKLNEARNLLEEGLTPLNKTLREIYDVQNTEKVFLWLVESIEQASINNDFIVKIHKGLMENIDVRTGYRTEDVRVFRSNFDSTPAPYVKTDMNLLLEWLDKNDGLHPLVKATAFHHKLEKIHPFMDGNGRTGRMLLNAILMKEGYPPLIILKKSRIQYLEALRKADKGNIWETKEEFYNELVKFTADEMIESYWNIFL